MSLLFLIIFLHLSWCIHSHYHFLYLISFQWKSCEVSWVSRMGICYCTPSRVIAKMKRWHLCLWGEFRAPWSFTLRGGEASFPSTRLLKPVWPDTTKPCVSPSHTHCLSAYLKGHCCWVHTVFLPPAFFFTLWQIRSAERADVIKMSDALSMNQLYSIQNGMWKWKGPITGLGCTCHTDSF